MIRIELNGADYDQLQQQMAKFACAAFWRGRLETSGLSDDSLEQQLQQLTDANWPCWREAARAHLSLGGVHTDRSGADRKLT